MKKLKLVEQSTHFAAFSGEVKKPNKIIEPELWLSVEEIEDALENNLK
jgi:hypothetical protein